MKKPFSGGLVIAVCVILISVGICVQRASAHHSFAMYDQTKVLVLTGVAHQFIAQANHAELHFYLIGPDDKLERDKNGNLVDWGVEMAGAAAVAREGITAQTFKAGTIFTVRMNPLRSGGNFGSRVGPIYKCPWRTPPTPGKTCKEVAGMTVLGGSY
ncbi:MAG: DUF6152 family protein [Candidatus Acidiferrales bacterium]